MNVNEAPADTSGVIASFVKRYGIFYGWVLLALGFLCMAIAYGVRNSFAIFYVYILREFGWGRAETAIIYSTSVFSYGFIAPVSGALVDRFGPRRVMPIGCLLLTLGAAGCSLANQIWQFSLLFGVLAAMGTCMTGYVSNATVLSRWFVRRRGLVFGLLNMGFGLSFVFSTISGLLIVRFDWRTSYLVLAALVAFVLLPLVVLFSRHQPQDMGLLPDGDTEATPVTGVGKLPPDAATDLGRRWQSTVWTLPKALKTYHFWVIFLANLMIWGIGENLFVAHQVAFATDIGMDSAAASSIASIFGVTLAIGALGGPIADRLGRERAFTIGCSVAGLGALTVILASYVEKAWMVYLFAVMLGLGMGIAGPALTGAVADLFAGRHFGAINGTMVMGFGMGGVIGPWLGGYIFDITGTYSLAFLAALLAIVTSCVLLWIAAPRKIVPISTRR